MLTKFTTPRLGVILPAYNEQEVLPTTLSKLNTIKATLIQKNLISDDSFIMVVDDGSVDNTWEIIQEKEQLNSDLIGVKLSRNFGHQSALLAGMSESIKLADIVITLMLTCKIIQTLFKKWCLNIKRAMKSYMGSDPVEKPIHGSNVIRH